MKIKGKKIKHIPLVSILNMYLLLTILSFCAAAAHYWYPCEKNVFVDQNAACKAIFYFFYLLSFFPIQCLLQNSDIISGSYYDEQPIFKIQKWATAWRYIILKFFDFILLLAFIKHFVDFFLCIFDQNRIFISMLSSLSLLPFSPFTVEICFVCDILN